MPRITDNVMGGRPWAVKINADNLGTVKALNFSTAAISQYQPVVLTMDEGGWVIMPSTQAAATVPTVRYIGIVQEAVSAASTATFEVGVVGASYCLSTIAHALGQAIVRSTGATVDSISGADFTGAVGQWGVCMSTAAASTTPRKVYLTGWPIVYVTSTASF